MGQMVPVIINPRGPLDTTNPVTDRLPGTLRTAVDVHPRYWGPRKGMKAFTRTWEESGSGIYTNYYVYAGVDDSTFMLTDNAHVRDLGLKFTLDLWVRLNDITYASAKDNVGLITHDVYNGGYVAGTAVGYVRIKVITSGADAGKLKVLIKPTSSRGVAGTEVTFTTSTTLGVGTTVEDRHHLRLVRDGATATLYKDGTSIGSTSSLAVQPILGSYTGQGSVELGVCVASPTEGFWKGEIFGAMMRDGAYSSVFNSTLPSNASGRNVHYFLVSRQLSGSKDHIPDFSNMANHSVVIGGPSVTAATSNIPPINAPVQGMTTWSNPAGKTITTVAVGGRIYSRYV